MTRAPLLATARGIEPLAELGAAGALDAALPGSARWEIEVGFGKGRYLLTRAALAPERRFLGIESAGEYFRLAAGRLAKRRLANVALVQGDALALLATTVPAACADALHVYFPDPWPKGRHARRRLVREETLDVLLRVLAPGGRLFVATDHAAYAEQIARTLEAQRGVLVRRVAGGWPEGPRTNYEAKYVAEGRPIARFEVTVAAEGAARPAAPAALALAHAGANARDAELEPARAGAER